MKKETLFLGLGFLALTAVVPASAQGTPGCPGCMPKIQRIWDSTHVTPAPSFTTSASTGAVHIPPRIIEVQVPAPVQPPANTDFGFFETTLFQCVFPDGSGMNGALAAVASWYKEIGGRCPDGRGMEGHAALLYSCGYLAVGEEVDRKKASWFRNVECTAKANISGVINTQQDVDGVNAICRAEAKGRPNASAYKYVRSPTSTTCSRL